MMNNEIHKVSSHHDILETFEHFKAKGWGSFFAQP